MNISGLKSYGMPACLLVLSFLSFQFNLFRVTSQERFDTFQLDSEGLILDGIVHHRLVSSASSLGHFRRAVPDTQAFLNDREHMDRVQDARPFLPYLSQFGLQYHVFDFLHSKCHLSVQQLEAVASLLMSLIVVGYFIALRRIVPTMAALGFCLAIALSPWTVYFARNLFWVEATWFLPCLVTLFLGNRRLTSANQLVLALLLFIATLIKFLCGYDFITTVCLAALVPLAYYHAKYSSGVKVVVRQLGFASLAMFLAFACAIGLHLAFLNGLASSPNDAASVSGAAKSTDIDNGGLALILRTAEKRLYSRDPDKTANEVCRDASGDGTIDPACVSLYEKSLKSNVLPVVARYFVFPHMVPWVDIFDVQESNKTVLRSVLSSVKGKRFTEALYFTAQFHGSTLLSKIMFLTLNVLVAYALYRRKRLSDLLWLGIAFAAPLSWYVVAKGYSEIHTHLCYVLWYLPYIPVAITLLLCEYSKYRMNKVRVPLRRADKYV